MRYSGGGINAQSSLTLFVKARHHTFGSGYMINGGDLYELANILGHSNIELGARCEAGATVDRQNQRHRAGNVEVT